MCVAVAPASGFESSGCAMPVRQYICARRMCWTRPAMDTSSAYASPCSDWRPPIGDCSRTRALGCCQCTADGGRPCRPCWQMSKGPTATWSATQRGTVRSPPSPHTGNRDYSHPLSTALASWRRARTDRRHRDDSREGYRVFKSACGHIQYDSSDARANDIEQAEWYTTGTRDSRVVHAQAGPIRQSAYLRLSRKATFLPPTRTD
jgi:hypothetical protein